MRSLVRAFVSERRAGCARARARARASTHVLRVGLLRQQHLDLKELRGGAAARPAGVDRRGEGGEVHKGVAARAREQPAQLTVLLAPSFDSELSVTDTCGGLLGPAGALARCCCMAAGGMATWPPDAVATEETRVQELAGETAAAP